MKINGATILVTGGGRGLGRYFVEHFIASGAKLIVLENDVALCAELNTLFADSLQAFVCDVSDSNAVDQTFEKIKELGVKVDILVNNAGIIHNELLVNFASRAERVHSRETWRKVMSVDLDSVFYVTSCAVDHMLANRKKGVVLSISSIAAKGNAGQTAYSAAKAAVIAMSNTWSKELGALGLRFVTISPGFIDVASTRSALNESTLTKLQQQTALRKLGSEESVFQALCYAIENDYVTGTNLEVDGGLVF